MPCRHCGRIGATRPRGLCWTCFDSRAIRRLYPTASNKYAHRGWDSWSDIPLADLPTTALPGTPEKLAVLQQRAGLQQALWHPADAPAGFSLD